MIDLRKVWLVRTKEGEISGPFNQEELINFWKNSALKAEDEIAASCGRWIKAQILFDREKEELTQTSTRNTALTQSFETAPITYSGNIAQQSNNLLKNKTSYETSYKVPTKILKTYRPQKVMIVLFSVVIAVLWLIVTYLKPKPVKDTSSHINKFISSDSQFISDIYNLIQSGQFNTALAKLTYYHEKEAKPDDVKYLIPYSALLILEGDSPSMARRFLEKVLASEKNEMLKANAHHWLGYLMLSQEERDMGENHFLEALQINRRDPAARFNLGRAYLKQEKYRQALDYFQLAELELPDLWLIHIFMGRAKAALGLIEEARSSFEKAISLDKDRWISYTYYALFLYNIKKTRDAQKVISTMLLRDPNYETSAPPPFGFYVEKTDFREYLSAYSYIMNNTTGEDKELGKLYINYLINGPSSEEATKILTIAEKGNLKSKIFALKVLEDQEADKEKFASIVKSLPQHLSEFGYYAYVLRAEALMKTGEFEKAHDDIQRALTIEPQSAIIHWVKAMLLQKISKNDSAKKEIEKLLSFYPTYIPAIVTLQKMK